MTALIALTDARARCRDLPDPDVLYDANAEAMKKVAAQVCAPCRLRVACLAEALDARIEFGVWGGMTALQRRRLIYEHPQVTNWVERLTVQEHAPPLRVAAAGASR